MSGYHDLQLSVLPDSPPRTPPPPAPAPCREESPHPEIPGLVAACTTGDIETIKNFFSTLTDQLNKISEKDRIRFQPVLDNAFRHNQPEIANYLFCIGFHVQLFLAQLAADISSTSLFEVLIKHGWNMNKPLTQIGPPLLADIVEKDHELTRWFLENGADPNGRGFYDNTPASIAAGHAPLRTLALLLDHGANPLCGQLVFHAASREVDAVKAISMLLDRIEENGDMFDINSRLYDSDPNTKGHLSFMGLGTPLHHAADAGQMEAVKWLLDKGADARIRDSRGHLPRDLASQKGFRDIAELLLEAEDTDLEPRDVAVLFE